MGDDLGTRLVDDETCVTELATLGLAEANSNFIGPAIRVWGPPPLQSYDNEGINKALRQLDCFLYTSQSNISHTPTSEIQRSVGAVRLISKIR